MPGMDLLWQMRQNILKIAKYQADSNNDSGVLNVIDKILRKEPPFAGS